MLDFETDRGFNPFPLLQFKKLIDHLEYGHRYRIYFLILLVTGARPSEPTLMNWKKHFTGDLIVYKPSKGKRMKRICRVPPLILKEINYFKNNNFFENGNLFSFKYKSLERIFNRDIRRVLGDSFTKKCDFKLEGVVNTRHEITIRGLRVTIGTIIYMYFRKVYGDNVALSRTCMWLGHESRKMTADHYIKHMHKIGLEHFPDLPLLQLLDHIIYNEHQIKLCEYARQCKIEEY